MNVKTYTYRVFTSQLLNSAETYTFGGTKTFDTLAQAEREAKKQATAANKCSTPWREFHTVISEINSDGWGHNVLTIEITKGHSEKEKNSTTACY